MPLTPTRGVEKYNVVPGIIAAADPAANAEQTYTIPSGQLFELWAINFSLVTDANAANRRVVLTFDDGTTVYCKVPSGHVQAASLTYNYTWAVGAQTLSAVVGTDTSVALPGPMVLRGGHRIKTVTTSLQATDNYGIMQLYGLRYRV